MKWSKRCDVYFNLVSRVSLSLSSFSLSRSSARAKWNWALHKAVWNISPSSKTIICTVWTTSKATVVHGRMQRKMSWHAWPHIRRSNWWPPAMFPVASFCGASYLSNPSRWQRCTIGITRQWIRLPSHCPAAISIPAASKMSWSSGMRTRRMSVSLCHACGERHCTLPWATTTIKWPFRPTIMKCRSWTHDWVQKWSYRTSHGCQTIRPMAASSPLACRWIRETAAWWWTDALVICSSSRLTPRIFCTM